MEDNSVLLEDTVSEDTLTNPPRRSLSQPSLGNNNASNSAARAGQQQGPSNAQFSSNPKHIPILQTWHENEELKGKMYTLRVEVQMHHRAYLEAKEACHKSVQEVLDEYVELKIGQEDMQEKAHRFAEMENELHALRAKVDEQNEELISQNKEFEQQKQLMEQRIRELEQIPSSYEGNNTTVGSLRGTLDDIMKKNDPDYTLTGYEERKINELENKLLNELDKVAELEEHIRNLRQELDDQSARLADSENHRAQLEAAAGQGILGAAGATFVLGNVRESATGEQIQYIDELETKLKAANNDSEKARLALVEYMNRCSKLEKDLQNLQKNSTFDTSSMIVGKTSDELKAQIEKVQTELNTLRTENHELRVRCNQLNGGDGNVSASLGESRLMAGISPAHLATSEKSTNSTSMRIAAHGSSPFNLQESQLNDSRALLLDSSAAIRTEAEFDAEWQAFQADKNRFDLMGNNSIESSFNASMPPPGADATQSFLSQKGFKNSPLAVSSKPAASAQQADNSFSTKATSMFANSNAPLFQDVQQLLESSQILIDGQQDTVANVEKMQENMKLVREALARLFERLKSSAALFEEILEKMGSSSPLADRIKQMKLAFETSLCDHADVSVLLEAAEKDLTNMSLNVSNLEKSILGQSFSADVSKRFSTAPAVEDISSSSLLKAPYSPIFKLPSMSRLEEVEKLQREVAELKNELDLARARELRSPLHESSGRLSDVQIKAAQNFEELEVCQATLKKVEAEKINLQKDLAELDSTHRHTVTHLNEVNAELEKVSQDLATERATREKTESALAQSQQMITALSSTADEKCNSIMAEMQSRIDETREVHEEMIRNLQVELKKSLDEENALSDRVELLKGEAIRLNLVIHDAETKALRQDEERAQLVQQLYAMEDELTKLKKFEKESTDYSKKLAEKMDGISISKQRDETEKECVSGLERIQKELTELTKKTVKKQIVLGEASSIRMVCDEICHRISQERTRQHEDAEALRTVNDKIEQMNVEKENAVPSTIPHPSAIDNQKATSSSKYQCPTRQLLRESTIAVDSIVQRLKKTCIITGMSQELKQSVVELLTDARALREFLHQKLLLFKGIDVANWKNETVEQLLERLEQCYQNNLMLEDENRKMKKDLKKVKADISNLGTDVQERIKREIGGIAKDMGAVKALQKKK